MVLSFFLVAGFTGCGRPNWGIEAGNPDLKGKTVTLNPEGEATYAIQIVDEAAAVVSQIKAEEFETVSAFYQQNGTQIALSTVFSDGNQLSLQLNFDEYGNLLEVLLTLNGQPTPTGFQQGEDQHDIGDKSLNAAFLLSGSLCERIVDCNTTFLQEDCEANVEVVPGLTQEFGNSQNQTLAESAARIENGELLVDEEALRECLSGIQLVTCQMVQKDFNDQGPPNYNQIRKLIPKPICAQGVLLSGGNP